MRCSMGGDAPDVEIEDRVTAAEPSRDRRHFVLGVRAQ
jgi:hypothetical protein